MAIRQLRGGQGKAYALPNSNMPFPAASLGGRTHNSITLVAQTTRRCEVAWRTVAACALGQRATDWRTYAATYKFTSIFSLCPLIGQRTGFGAGHKGCLHL